MVLLVACSQPPTSSPSQMVQGVLLDVAAPSLQKVDSFTIRTNDGQELRFTAASNFNQGVAHQMTPGHMRQHMALADPVEVTYRTASDGSLVALSAVDVSPQ